MEPMRSSSRVRRSCAIAHACIACMIIAPEPWLLSQRTHLCSALPMAARAPALLHACRPCDAGGGPIARARTRICMTAPRMLPGTRLYMMLPRTRLCMARTHLCMTAPRMLPAQHSDVLCSALTSVSCAAECPHEAGPGRAASTPPAIPSLSVIMPSDALRCGEGPGPSLGVG